MNAEGFRRRQRKRRKLVRRVGDERVDLPPLKPIAPIKVKRWRYQEFE